MHLDRALSGRRYRQETSSIIQSGSRLALALIVLYLLDIPVKSNKRHHWQQLTQYEIKYFINSSVRAIDDGATICILIYTFYLLTTFTF